MTTNGRTAAVGATTTTADELHVPGGSTNDPTPTARACLQPGSVGWWVLSVDGRPAVKFHDVVHAALTLRDVVDDLRDRFAFWAACDGGRFTSVTAEYLQVVVEGNRLGGLLAGSRADSYPFIVCKGW